MENQKSLLLRGTFDKRTLVFILLFERDSFEIPIKRAVFVLFRRF